MPRLAHCRGSKRCEMKSCTQMASSALAFSATSRPPQECDSPAASMSGMPHHRHVSGAGGPNVNSGEAGGLARRRSAAPPHEWSWPITRRAPHPHPHNSGSAVRAETSGGCSGRATRRSRRGRRIEERVRSTSAMVGGMPAALPCHAITPGSGRALPGCSLGRLRSPPASAGIIKRPSVEKIISFF